jgi:predicted AAA+ superfamily ATPase
MQRTALLTLQAWKIKQNRKPLIIQGARQVGKTWLMKSFGETSFEQTVYFNFENQQELRELFQQSLKSDNLLKGMSIIAGFTINPESCLIIFDEIQACSEAITSLKYFYEERPEAYIVAAGSLLGVSIHQGVSFPVGKVEFMALHPFSFTEFLLACGHSELLENLNENNKALTKVFENKYIELLKNYFFVGGMPEAVKIFTQGASVQEIRRLQNDILKAYENDFSKHAPVSQLPRIRLVWNSIVSQLSKENTKFIFNVLRPGARAKDFELALEWLKDAGLIHKITRITKSGIPLTAYADWNDFKLYFVDVGLLGALAQIPEQILLNGNSFFTEFKGVLTEQFVLQQLLVNELIPFYWRPENAQAEVDFVIQKGIHVIPIEVKSGTSLQAKSLWVYSQKYKPKFCVRTSLKLNEKNDWVTDIPLYRLGAFLELDENI